MPLPSPPGRSDPAHASCPQALPATQEKGVLVGSDVGPTRGWSLIHDGAALDENDILPISACVEETPQAFKLVVPLPAPPGTTQHADIGKTVRHCNLNCYSPPDSAPLLALNSGAFLDCADQNWVAALWRREGFDEVDDTTSYERGGACRSARRRLRRSVRTVEAYVSTRRVPHYLGK
jgi:hypothetical protein